MQTMPREAFETSVTFSLTELARLEQERQREEELQRAQAREEHERRLREAESARRRAEESRASAEAQARRRREREEAEATALAEARALATVAVARIEAEAKTRLEADNAQRAHELGMLRLREEKGHHRERWVLATALGLVCSLGTLGLYAMEQSNKRLGQDLDQLEQEKASAMQERDQARSSHFNALNRRYAALVGRPLAREASEALAAASRTRRAAGESSVEAKGHSATQKGVDPAKLSAFAIALDALQQRLDAVEELAALDRRYADLALGAARYRRGRVTSAYAEATRAKTAHDENPAALASYERSLDRLRDSLAPSGPSTNRYSNGSAPTRTTTQNTSQVPCGDGDPVCGLEGQAL